MTRNSNYAAAVAIAPPRLAWSLDRILARIAAFLAGRAAAFARARRERASVRELMALSNRQLKDLGIDRTEILSVVYGPPGERRIGIEGRD